MSEFTLIEASGGAKPKVVGVAYSGGKMNLPGWKHPVIVESILPEWRFPKASRF